MAERRRLRHQRTSYECVTKQTALDTRAECNKSERARSLADFTARNSHFAGARKIKTIIPKVPAAIDGERSRRRNHGHIKMTNGRRTSSTDERIGMRVWCERANGYKVVNAKEHETKRMNQRKRKMNEFDGKWFRSHVNYIIAQSFLFKQNDNNLFICIRNAINLFNDNGNLLTPSPSPPLPLSTSSMGKVSPRLKCVIFPILVTRFFGRIGHAIGDGGRGQWNEAHSY